MPQQTRAHCLRCGRHKDEAGPISWRGNCHDCGERRERENNDALHYQRGAPLQRWRMGYARKLFGPEVTTALANAGYFRVPVDESVESR